MIKHMTRKVILETQQCLTHYWQKDCTYAAERLDQDIVWIGAVANEFMQGISAVTKNLEETNSTNPLCHMLQQEFWCIYEDLNTWIVTGRYLVTTDTESGEILQEQQRATFVWTAEREKLKIVHMHISQPIGYLEQGEVFPHKIGKMSYQYLQRMIECQWKNIQIKELSGHIYFLSEAELEYAEAKGHNTIIGVLHGTLTARVDWKDFQKELSPEFIKVHRSFVINRRYIKLLDTNDILMQSGARIPVPAKKRKEIYRHIALSAYKT